MTESYTDRMHRCIFELLELIDDPDRILHELELFAIFDECDDDRLAHIFNQCIRSDSDIDEMTAILDDPDELHSIRCLHEPDAF